MKKIFYFILIFGFFIPISVSAKTTVNSSAPAILETGKNYEINIGNDETFNILDLALVYDNKNISIISISGINGAEVVNLNNLNASPIKFKINNKNNSALPNGYMKIVLRINDNATGNYSSFEIQDVTGKNDTYGVSLTYNVLSGDTGLSSLNVTSGIFDKPFATNIHEYNVSFPIGTTNVEISGTASNYNATISGLGIVDISKNSRFVVTVKSENGHSSDYIINTSTFSNSSSDSSLKSIVSTIGAIDFKKDVFKYDIEVPFNTSEIEVTAIPTSILSSVNISGLGSLNVGENLITINVVSEDGSSSNYYINVKRNDEEIDQTTNLSSNNNLLYLNIDGYNFKFHPNNLEYRLHLSDESALNIKAIPEDDKALVNIIGNENLAENSVVNIVVTAEDGKNKVYKITLVSGDSVSDEIVISNNFIPIAFLIFSIILFCLVLYYVFFNKKIKKKN